LRPRVCGDKGGALESEDTGVEVGQEEQRWFIDADWLEQSDRSFAALAERCLCADCRKRLRGNRERLSGDELFAKVRDCCSGAPDYITGATPIMESAFRLFLATGNKPLDLLELGRRLSDWRGVDTYRTSIEVLYRLLKYDRYYGIRPARS